MYYDISFRKTKQSKDMDYVRCTDWNSAMEWLKENGGSMSTILIFQFDAEMPNRGGHTYGR